MLRIVYPICCGLDVHKSTVSACIAATDGNGVTTYQERKFTTFTKDLKSLAYWLAASNCKDVCMESSGKYWHPVWNILEATCNLVIAHPKYVKAIRGKKTDKKDAKWIADIFKHDLVSGSFIPPNDIRQLRDLTRYYRKLVGFNTGEKNRTQNSLTVSNIKLDDVFADVFGKSATAIMDYLLEHPGETFDVTPFVDGRCKTPIEKIQAAVEGAICPEQVEKLKVIRSHIKNLELCKANLESAVLTIAEKYLPQINLVLSVPGFSDPFVAISIIGEIGVDMSVFPSDKQICSWAGLTPQNNESAGKKKTTRINHAGAYIKPLLVQCALAVSNSEKHPEIRNRYLALKKRRGHKKAVIAIARMLLTAIYHILKNNEPYNPELYRKSDKPPVNRQVSVDEAIFILQRQGYIISQPQSVID